MKEIRKKQQQQQQQQQNNKDKKEQGGTEDIVKRSELNDFVVHLSQVFSS